MSASEVYFIGRSLQGPSAIWQFSNPILSIRARKGWRRGSVSLAERRKSKVARLVVQMAIEGSNRRNSYAVSVLLPPA